MTVNHRITHLQHTETAADPGSVHLHQTPATAGTPEEVVQEHTQVKWNTFREGASTALQTSASETHTFKNIEAVSCGSGAA